MPSQTRSLIYSIVLATFAASATYADEVDGLITFTAGTPARASEVNDNFAAVKTAVDGTHADVLSLQQALTTLQDTVAALTTQLTALQSENAALAAEVGALTSQLTATEEKFAALETENATLASQLDGVLDSQVMALTPYLTVTGGARPTVMLSGVNLQIVNGEGSTAIANGLGNLIVGYDEENPSGNPFCSEGDYTDQAACEAAGHTWSRSHKSGSHYVVVGEHNSYSQFGGIVAGWANASTGQYASVTGGAVNRAGGAYSAVSGGNENVAGSNYSSVSGGAFNTASGAYSSVSGGGLRTAPTAYDWAAGSLLEDL